MTKNIRTMTPLDHKKAAVVELDQTMQLAPGWSAVTDPYGYTLTGAAKKHLNAYWRHVRAYDQMTGAAENPLSSTGKVLLGVAALGAIAAVFYAVNASANPAATLTTGSSPPPGTTMAISLTSADSGFSVNADVGDGISIALPPTASGQQWTATDQQNGVLTLQGNNGSSVVYTATAAGQDTITLTLINTSTGQAVSGTAPLTYPVTVTSGGASSGSGPAPLAPPSGNQTEV